jgi:hypothetical protein
MVVISAADYFPDTGIIRVTEIASIIVFGSTHKSARKKLIHYPANCGLISDF